MHQNHNAIHCCTSSFDSCKTCFIIKFLPMLLMFQISHLIVTIFLILFGSLLSKQNGTDFNLLVDFSVLLFYLCFQTLQSSRKPLMNLKKAPSFWKIIEYLTLNLIFFGESLDECSGSTCGPWSSGWEPLCYTDFEPLAMDVTYGPIQPSGWKETSKNVLFEMKRRVWFSNV